MAIPWQDVINNIKAEDLPEKGTPAPLMESIEGVIKIKHFFVQKLVTEVFIYTDPDNQIQGETTFQSSIILGEMTPRELNRMIKEERRNRAKESQ